MNNYLIIRYGLNAANQPLKARQPIGITLAAEAEEAIRNALDCGVSCDSNQYLEAIVMEEAASQDLREVMGIWLIPSRSSSSLIRP